MAYSAQTISIIELYVSKIAAAEYCFIQLKLDQKYWDEIWLLLFLRVKVGQGNRHTA